MKYTDLEMVAGERIIGMKWGKRGAKLADNYDFQFGIATPN